MREIFIPKKRIPAIQMDIDEYRELYNGKKDLYLSVYNYIGFGKNKDIIKASNAMQCKCVFIFIVPSILLTLRKSPTTEKSLVVFVFVCKSLTHPLIALDGFLSGVSVKYINK